MSVLSDKHVKWYLSLDFSILDLQDDEIVIDISSESEMLSIVGVVFVLHL